MNKTEYQQKLYIYSERIRVLEERQRSVTNDLDAVERRLFALRVRWVAEGTTQ